MKYFILSEGFYQYPREGAIEITDDYHQELLQGQSKGLTISADESGYPILIAPDLREIARCRAATEKASQIELANKVMAPLQDAVDLNIATAQEKQQLKEWKTYRVLLSRIDTTADKIKWPEEPA